MPNIREIDLWRLVDKAFQNSIEKFGDIFAKDVTRDLISGGVKIPVLCKNCTHYFHFGDDVYGCRTYGMMKTNPDGFCSQGKRRNNEISD